jgi:hypothetical protein
MLSRLDKQLLTHQATNSSGLAKQHPPLLWASKLPSHYRSAGQHAVAAHHPVSTRSWLCLVACGRYNPAKGTAVVTKGGVLA